MDVTAVIRQPPGDNVHMQVRHSLLAAWPVIDTDGKTIWFQGCVYDIRNSFYSQKERSGFSWWQVSYPFCVGLRNDDAMSGSQRMDIQKSDSSLIFGDRVGRDLVMRYFTE
jgi:hypothetical protein